MHIVLPAAQNIAEVPAEEDRKVWPDFAEVVTAAAWTVASWAAASAVVAADKKLQERSRTLVELVVVVVRIAAGVAA